MNDIKLIHNDCLSAMAGLENESVACIVTDPPYGIGYHSNHYADKNPHAPVTNDWNFEPAPFFRECERVLKDGGALYAFCRWDVQPLWLPHLNSGLKIKNIIVWVKDNWSAGDLSGNFGNQYEQIIFATKGRHKRRGRRWSNVWEFPRVSHTKMVHPTQKPVPLLERAILASSDQGDLIADPFCGSGSTGVACSQLGRSAVLVDVDPRMIAVSAQRLGLPNPAPLVAVRETPPSPVFETPNPADWGIHPEDLVAIRDAMNGNLEGNTSSSRSLFDAFEGATS